MVAGPGGDGIPEADIGGQDRYRARQLDRALAQDQLHDLRTRAQFAASALHLDLVLRAPQNCDQRHTLRCDDQADDQCEKPVAETVHVIRSNMLVDGSPATHKSRRALEHSSEIQRTWIRPDAAHTGHYAG